MKKLGFFALAVLFVLGGGELRAGLLGDTVTVDCVAQLPSPGSDCLLGGGPSNVVVGAFAEGEVFSLGDNVFFDIEDEAIVLWPNVVPTFLPSPSASFGGLSQLLTFSGLDWVGMPDVAITGVDVMVYGPLDPPLGGVSFTDHSVQVDFGESQWAGETVVIINLETGSSATVPEPGTWALLAAGLAALGLRRRRGRG